MAQAKNSMSKLDRLTTLRDSLLDCCKESVKNADEWQTFHDMLEKVKEMISDEHRRLGYMLENKPEMKGNIIVLQL